MRKQTRGAVSATLIPGKADSAGTQFFIAVTDQPGIDGKYTIFARVVEGMLAVQKISETAVDDKGPRRRSRGRQQGHDSRQAGGDA
jgi:cyclophilin family peptidyl-prolyl cis-trans isomerase